MNLITIQTESAVSIPLRTVEPRFGSPGAAALFVGQDLFHDYFFFPLSRCAVVLSEQGERLLTAFEETARDAALFDIAADLFELSSEGGIV